MSIFSGLVGQALNRENNSNVMLEAADDRSFEQAVTEARKNRSSRILDNRSLDHARHVMLELIELSIENNKPLFIVSGRLNETCFNSTLKDSIKKLCTSGTRAEIIVTELTEDQVRGNSFARFLIGQLSTEVYVAKDKSAPIADAPHFAVSKGFGYRFETDKGEAKAILSFNQPSVAEKLEREFFALKRMCRKVEEVN